MLRPELDRGEGLAEMQLQRNQVVLGAFQLGSAPCHLMYMCLSLESLFLVAPLNQ